MFAIIVGGGRVGSYLAENLLEDGHRVSVVEKREDVLEKLHKEVPKAEIIEGDGSDPETLEKAGANKADLLAAVTGLDEDNIVIGQLAKYTFKVDRVVARVNNPKNEWLFTRQWGIDVAVSAVHIIAKIIQEEATLGDIITLLKLKKGAIALLELNISEASKSVGKAIKELPLPPETALITAILRDGQIKVPKGETIIEANDQILALSTVENEEKLKKALL
jgi:trk system potassium uptake protein TrkA